MAVEVAVVAPVPKGVVELSTEPLRCCNAATDELFNSEVTSISRLVNCVTWVGGDLNACLSTGQAHGLVRQDWRYRPRRPPGG